jgi:hypothetical protein
VDSDVPAPPPAEGAESLPPLAAPPALTAGAARPGPWLPAPRAHGLGAGNVATTAEDDDRMAAIVRCFTQFVCFHLFDS